VFGEMALLLKDHKRIATATALEHCETVEISRRAFRDYIDRSPSVISSILKALAGRLQVTTMRALRTPDLFMAACEVLCLFGANGGDALPYGETVQSLSKAFLVDAKQIEGLLEMMLNANLIEPDRDQGKIAAIHIRKTDDFLQRADKIYNGLKNIP